jgi:hypothetical protein
MLKFHMEWIPAPGVRDQVLARTWARLEIEASDDPAHILIPTECINLKANSLQEGVYGSVFPLAEWVVENWWFLLNEPCRIPDYPGGRRLSGDDQLRWWVQRHDLLAAREGGALPDLSLYRDGPDVVLKWVPDPDPGDQLKRVRFIGAGEIRLEPSDIERSLGEFVEAVLVRLNHAADEDSLRLRVNWQAVCNSRSHPEDIRSCSWLASIGYDPYDPEETSQKLEELFDSYVVQLDPAIRDDLLEAATVDSFEADLDWVNQASNHFSFPPEARTIEGRRTVSLSAHQLGYEQARTFRRQFDISIAPIDDLAALLHQRCGWPQDPRIQVKEENSGNVIALVGKDTAGSPRLAESDGKPASRKFRLARSLYFVPSADAQVHPRLITKAYTWDQRASRAFAAELLAPAEALRSELSNRTSPEQVEKLAEQFGVSTMVIEHQIKNHELSFLEYT